MKNISWILNIVLLVAVVVLYVLRFSGGSSEHSYSGGRGSIDGLRIALVNSDTLLEHYDYLEVKRKELETKSEKMDQDYRDRAESLQQEYNNYQRNVNNLTIGQVRVIEEDLQKKQQNLRMYQQSLSQQMMEEQDKLNRELYDRVTAYLKRYGQEKGLHIVFKFDPASDVLFAGDSLDITNDVLTGLNEEYRMEGKGSIRKPAADSAAIKKK